MQEVRLSSTKKHLLVRPFSLEAKMDFLNIDLESIKFKLMSKKSGLGWSLELCDAVEIQYKRWMTCIQRYPDIKFVPSYYIDMFWHYHILDTQKYAADCNACLGYFVHHYPYFGMQGDSDKKNASVAWKTTKDIFRIEFDCEVDALEKTGQFALKQIGHKSEECTSEECTPGACAGQECENPDNDCSSKLDLPSLTNINAVRPQINRTIN